MTKGVKKTVCIFDGWTTDDRRRNKNAPSRREHLLKVHNIKTTSKGVAKFFTEPRNRQSK